MRFDIVVFDFDGTLVQSVDVKSESFFTVFPDGANYRAIVAGVLAEDPDGPRARVIPLMRQRMVDAGLPLPEAQTADDLIAAYGSAVVAGVSACPEMEGATNLLRELSGQTNVYVASNTPDAPLKALIAQRGWTGYVKGTFGYPHRKQETLETLMKTHDAPPDRVMMVGDGPSDANAARGAGCALFAVTGPRALIDLEAMLRA